MSCGSTYLGASASRDMHLSQNSANCDTVLICTNHDHHDERFFKSKKNQVAMIPRFPMSSILGITTSPKKGTGDIDDIPSLIGLRPRSIETNGGSIVRDPNSWMVCFMDPSIIDWKNWLIWYYPPILGNTHKLWKRVEISTKDPGQGTNHKV